MSLVPRNHQNKKAPEYQVTYKLKNPSAPGTKALVEKTAEAFEQKFASRTVTIAIDDSGKSFTATSKNEDDLTDLPETYGVGKFVRGEVVDINEDKRTWQEHARDHRF